MEFSQIREAAERDRAAVTRFLQDIMRIKSLSGGERQVVERIAAEMRATGFDEVRIDGLGNVIGRVGNGPRVIAIDAHIDTVDVGNPDNWEIDPFSAPEKDGVVYGRGACDMKGAMASLVYGAKIVKDLALAKGLTIYITGTVMEEDCDGLCWQYILREKAIARRPNVVVITEPTNLSIYRGHRGRMEMEVSAPGLRATARRPSAASTPSTRWRPSSSRSSSSTSAFATTTSSARAPSPSPRCARTSPSLCAVADSCTIHLDRRLTAGETIETAVAEIESLPAVKAANGKVRVLDYAAPAYTGLVYPTKKYYPTWVLAEDHPALKAAVSAYEKVLEAKPKVDKWTFSTNGIATMGMFGIPSFGLGPGNEEYAHSPKEHIPVDHLVKAAAFYAAFAEQYAATNPE